MPNKSQRHESIRERARDALRDLYHNATPRYPRLDDEEAEEFQSWFEGAAEFEIEYMGSGGAYGSDYARTLAAECNAGRYKSETARRYYIRCGMAKMQRERARCNNLDSRKAATDCQWERITEFGKLYAWGRGGRTLAPDNLIRQRGGGSFSIKEDYCDDMPIGAVVDLIRIVESFNRAVNAWCDSVPELWKEEKESHMASRCEIAELGYN